MSERRTVEHVVEGRRYRVHKVLGRGGFGTVYLADLLGEGGFRKSVALKVLNPEIANREDISGRLRDEARILGLLRHRAFVQVDGLARLDGRWTVVMEYIEGIDLCAALGAGPLPPRAALEVAAEVASALHTAYNTRGPDGQVLRLLHRDIKPNNIQLTAAGEVKLLDFGIARAEFEAREALSRGQPFGTPGYIAPERFEGRDGPEADIYALGVVLYESLTAMAFGPASGNPERQQARIREAVESLAVVQPGLHAGIASLLDRMLSCEPSARPTAREVDRTCDTLISLVGGEPLRSWAEAQLPRIRAARDSFPPDEMTGQELVERSAPRGDAPGRVSDPTWTGPVRASGSAAQPLTQTAPADDSGALKPMLLLLAIVGVVLGVWVFGQFGGAPVADELLVSVPASPPLATVEPPVASAPATVAAPATPTTGTTSPPAPVTTTAPTSSKVTKKPSVPTTGTVSVTQDDGLEIRLVDASAGRTASPGALVPGRWTVQVRRPGMDWSATKLVLDLRAGSRIELVCYASVLQCKGSGA